MTSLLETDGMFLALLLAVCVAVWFLVRWHNGDLPNEGEWGRLRAEITQFHRGNLTQQSFTKPTRQALAAVLTDEPGLIRRSEVPWALDLLETAIQRRTNVIRGYAGILITVGLFATVFIFKSVMDRLSLSPTTYGGVFDALSYVYLINAVVLGFAITLFLASASLARSGSRLIPIAQGVLDQLQDAVTDAADPRLIKAIEILGQKQDAKTEKILSGQLDRVQNMLEEMTRLADGIQEVVKNLARQKGNGPEQIAAPIRAIQATMESFHERMDLGLKQMVEPFAAGVPSIHKLEGTLGTLSKAVASLEKADPHQATRRLEETAALLETTVGLLEKSASGLPTALFHAFGKLESDVPDAVSKGLMTGIGKTLGNLSEQMTAPVISSNQELRAAQEILSERLVELTQSLETDRQQLPRLLSSAVHESLRGDLHSLQVSIGSLTPAISELRAATQDLTKTLKEAGDKGDSGRSFWKLRG